MVEALFGALNVEDNPLIASTICSYLKEVAFESEFIDSSPDISPALINKIKEAAYPLLKVAK